MNIALWVVQALLAFAFGMAGFAKATSPFADLAAKMPWTTAVPPMLVRFIGAAELTGVVGLLLPALTRVMPVLTGWAGVGLATIMVLAAGFHASRGEWSVLPVHAVLGGLSVFVAWGRLMATPIRPR